MKLSTDQFNQLQQALLDAYDRDGLRQLVRQAFNQSLDAIAGGSADDEVVASLLEWAEQTGNVPALIAAATAAKPNDPALQTLAADAATWSLSTAPEPDSVAPQTAIPSQPDAREVAAPPSRAASIGSRAQLSVILPLLVAVLLVVAILMINSQTQATYFPPEFLTPVPAGATPTPTSTPLPTGTDDPTVTPTYTLIPTATLIPTLAPQP